MAGGSQKLFQGMDQGALGQAQQFANQGNWGQAAQAYQQGGGQGFTQPQYQAFTQQYGNVGSPAGQLGGVFGPPGGQGGVDYYPGEIIADGPGSGMWGPPGQAQPLQPPSQAQPLQPPSQAQPAAPPGAIAVPTAPSHQPPPGFVPRPPPQMSAPQTPNWASYVQKYPDLIAHYNTQIKDSGKSMGDWGQEHWNRFGQNENRTNPYSGLLGGGGYGEKVIYD